MNIKVFSGRMCESGLRKAFLESHCWISELFLKFTCVILLKQSSKKGQISTIQNINKNVEVTVTNTSEWK